MSLLKKLKRKLASRRITGKVIKKRANIDFPSEGDPQMTYLYTLHGFDERVYIIKETMKDYQFPSIHIDEIVTLKINKFSKELYPDSVKKIYCQSEYSH